MSIYIYPWVLIRFLYLREDVPARIDKMCVLFVRVRDPFKLKRLKTNSVELLFWWRRALLSIDLEFTRHIFFFKRCWMFKKKGDLNPYLQIWLYLSHKNERNNIKAFLKVIFFSIHIKHFQYLENIAMLFRAIYIEILNTLWKRP